jgi:hypothetical protein
LEVCSLLAAEHAGDVFPTAESWSNQLTCPSSLLIRIAHFLYDTDLLSK